MGLGRLNGYNNAETTVFKVEQWNNTGVFGVTNGGLGRLGDNSTGSFAGVASYSSALSGAEISGLYAAYSAVPEPSSAALVGLGGLALILRRRK